MVKAFHPIDTELHFQFARAATRTFGALPSFESGPFSNIIQAFPVFSTESSIQRYFPYKRVNQVLNWFRRGTLIKSCCMTDLSSSRQPSKKKKKPEKKFNQWIIKTNIKKMYRIFSTRTHRCLERKISRNKWEVKLHTNEMRLMSQTVNYEWSCSTRISLFLLLNDANKKAKKKNE